MRSNVRELRPPSPPSIWAARLYATLLYLFMGLLLVQGGPGDGDFNLVFLLAIIYWAFISKQIHTHPRFKQNIVLVILLTALVLFVYRAVAIPLALLAALYWLMIIVPRGSSYFLRYHLLTALILGMVLCLIFLTLKSTFLCGFYVGVLTGGAEAMIPVKDMFFEAYVGVGIVVCGGGYLYMAIGALFGKTPRLPFVSSQAQYMA